MGRPPSRASQHFTAILIGFRFFVPIASQKIFRGLLDLPLLCLSLGHLNQKQISLKRMCPLLSRPAQSRYCLFYRTLREMEGGCCWCFAGPLLSAPRAQGHQTRLEVASQDRRAVVTSQTSRDWNADAFSGARVRGMSAPSTTNSRLLCCFHDWVAHIHDVVRS